MFRYRGTGWELPRLLLVLVTNSLGWVVIGTGLLIGGLIWGLSSHDINYQSYPKSSSYHVSTGEQTGNVYIYTDGSPDYFVAFLSDFPHTVSDSDLHSFGAVSFVARTNMSRLDPVLNTGTATINQAHKIEKLVFYDPQGNVLHTYTTDEYNAHPDSYTVNNWLYGGALMLVGVLAGGNGLFFHLNGRQRRMQAAAEERARLESMPSPFARELGEMPRPRPYQGTEQYPQSNYPYRGPQQ